MGRARHQCGTKPLLLSICYSITISDSRFPYSHPPMAPPSVMQPSSILAHSTPTLGPPARHHRRITPEPCVNHLCGCTKPFRRINASVLDCLVKETRGRAGERVKTWVWDGLNGRVRRRAYDGRTSVSIHETVSGYPFAHHVPSALAIACTPPTTPTLLPRIPPPPPLYFPVAPKCTQNALGTSIRAFGAAFGSMNTICEGWRGEGGGIMDLCATFCLSAYVAVFSDVRIPTHPPFSPVICRARPTLSRQTPSPLQDA